MMSQSRKLPLISIGTLVVLAAAAALLLWFVAGPGNAGADKTVIKLHGETAQAQNASFGFANVSTNGSGKNKTTNIDYDNNAGAFGFGTIPNSDFKSNPNSASLNTDTSRVTGTTLGAAGAITFDLKTNGISSSSQSGSNSFGFQGTTTKESGHRTSESAGGTVSVVGNSGPVVSGNIGFQRINRTVTTP